MDDILILGDIHGRNFWRKENLNGKVVFLGDYLDPYSEEIMMAPELMECNDFYDSENLLKMLEDIVSLKKKNPEDIILLCGNHTLSYIWKNFNAASRTDYCNWKLYHEFFMDNLDYFQLIHVENNIIFSHAGITQEWAQKVWDALEYPKDGLSSIMEIAIMLRDTPLKYCSKELINLLGDISYYRGGLNSSGSCEWADLREHVNMIESTTTIVPKGEDRIFQIFGHTQVKTPIITKKWACVDCKKGILLSDILNDSKCNL